MKGIEYKIRDRCNTSQSDNLHSCEYLKLEMWQPTFTILCCLFAMASLQEVTTSPPSGPTCNSCNASVVSSNVTVAPGFSVNNAILRDFLANRFFSLITNLWNQFTPTTDLNRRFMEEVIRHASSPRPFVNAVGMFISLFINNFLPYFHQQPDACFMAAVINGTLACTADKNVTHLRSAVDQARDIYMNVINPGIERNLIFKSGCDFRCREYPPDLEVHKTVCYENGFVYPIRKMWARPHLADNKSPELLNLLYQMYNSTDYHDRFFAVSATFGSMIIPTEWDFPLIVAEVLDMQFGPPVQPACCYQRMARVDEIRKKYDEITLNWMETMRNRWANTVCSRF